MIKSRPLKLCLRTPLILDNFRVLKYSIEFCVVFKAKWPPWGNFNFVQSSLANNMDSMA